MHHHSRRLTPHPAGLGSIVAALFVVFAAFLAGADSCSSTSSVASRSRVQRVRVAPRAPSAGVDEAHAVVTDSVRGVDDGCAEYGELRRKLGGRSDKRLSSALSPTLLDAPRPLARARCSVALILRGRAAPPPVVPRAPPSV